MVASSGYVHDLSGYRPLVVLAAVLAPHDAAHLDDLADFAGLGGVDRCACGQLQLAESILTGFGGIGGMGC